MILRARFALVLALAMIAWVPKVAHAAPPTQTEWYGGEVLALDVGGLVLMGAGLGMTEKQPVLGPTTTVLGVLTYAAGAPILHFSKGEAGRGLGSLGMRLGLGGGIAALLAGIDGRSHGAPVLLLGAVALGAIGSIGVSAVDAFVLANREVTPPPLTETPSGPPPVQGLSFRFGAHHHASGRPEILF